MKIYEVEINTHDLVDENYFIQNGKRYMFATRELAADFVLTIRRHNTSLAVVTSRQHVRHCSTM